MILPRLEKRAKSYYVLVTNKHHAWYLNEKGEQVWRRFSNSYGYDYSYRGFAINKAQNIVESKQILFRSCKCWLS